MSLLIKVGIISSLVALTMACGGGVSEGSNDGVENNDLVQIPDNDAPSDQSPVGSHNAGKDCMNSGCHDGAGSAEKFRVSGTIFRSSGAAQANATVNLFVHNTNTRVASLQTDASGNFYTNAAVDGLSDGSGQLVTGVDIEVEAPGGLRTMPGLVTSGSCNSCHGQSNGRIIAN